MAQVLISRDYRGDVPLNCIDEFMTLVLDEEDEGLATPIVQSEQVNACDFKLWPR